MSTRRRQTDQERPAVPVGLGEAGRAVWEAVTGGWHLNPHLLAVLDGACRELDRAAQAEAAAAAEPFIQDRYGGTKGHPGIAVARSSRLAAARLLRVLDLELPATSPYGSPGHGGTLRKAEGEAEGGPRA